MHKYTFNTGEIVTSKLDKDELIKRMERLDTLRVLTEGYTEGVGTTICFTLPKLGVKKKRENQSESTAEKEKKSHHLRNTKIKA